MLRSGRAAQYGFEIRGRERGAFEVKWERLVVRSSDGSAGPWFRVKEGNVEVPNGPVNGGALIDVGTAMPAGTTDRLYLVAASGIRGFREVYDALLSMGFYNLNPGQMRELQSPDAGEVLARDGANVASVLARMVEEKPGIKERVLQFLQAIVPDITDFAPLRLGNRETIEFRQAVKGANHPWRFPAAGMSDGTLRALGVLVATMQLRDRASPMGLVGVEEPETALHPAAAGALMDAVREAAEHTQVLLTTHSPDLLDCTDIDRDLLLAVQSDAGSTDIAPADAASQRAIKEHLQTPGELLRQDQMQPDPDSLEAQRQSQFEWRDGPRT